MMDGVYHSTDREEKEQRDLSRARKIIKNIDGSNNIPNKILYELLKQIVEGNSKIVSYEYNDKAPSAVLQHPDDSLVPIYYSFTKEKWTDEQNNNNG